jgi:hypothetical protein
MISACLHLGFFLVWIFVAPVAKAQLSSPIGLYEGLMGNSGVAISDPTAASHFNPSLLAKKKADSYSLSGDSVGNYLSKSESTQSSSLSFNPTYLSTVLVGDALVHEFFILNLSPSNIKQISKLTGVDSSTNSESNLDINKLLFGYSMAFRGAPIALSYFGQYSQLKTFGFSEFTSTTSSLRSTSITKTDYRSLGVGISVSGHAGFESYTLGYQFRSRQLRIYSRSEGSTRLYSHGGASPSDYAITERESSNTSVDTLGSSIAIGHGFKTGDHEFLTDSQLQEGSDLAYRYSLTQSFGYRMNSKSGHQFLCGMNHRLGREVKYFGESAYYSVGYSWLKRAMRSGFGAYVYSSRIGQDVTVAGLTFGSEFNY